MPRIQRNTLFDTAEMEGVVTKEERSPIRKKFILTPFSVQCQQHGWWQDRKFGWIRLLA